jgi:hypothetical protein
MLQVPGGSLPEDLALEIEEAESLSTFLPRSTDAEPVSEFTLDFSTARLGQSAVLSIPPPPWARATWWCSRAWSAA